jgi:hemerythrin-like metal-binding protein
MQMTATTKPLHWSREMSVGIEVVDNEHRELAQAINELHAAIADIDKQSLTSPLLLKVAELTRAHFASEEMMMAANNYLGAALHAFKHLYLMQQLDALVARVNRGGFKLNEHSLKFLHDWFSTHIQKEDAQFAVWLNDVGKR